MFLGNHQVLHCSLNAKALRVGKASLTPGASDAVRPTGTGVKPKLANTQGARQPYNSRVADYQASSDSACLQYRRTCISQASLVIILVASSYAQCRDVGGKHSKSLNSTDYVIKIEVLRSKMPHFKQS